MVTRWYRPLEIVLNLPYDLKADVFSIGAMMLELYLGEEVFKSSSNIDQLYWICKVCGLSAWQPALDKMKQLGIYITPEEPKIYRMTKKLKQDATSLIVNMLQPAPNTRISSFDALKHPYFNKFQLSFNRSKRI